MSDRRLVITEDLVLISPVCLSMTNHILYFTVFIWSDKREQTVNSIRPWHGHILVVELTCAFTCVWPSSCVCHSYRYLDTTLGSTLYLVKFQIRDAKELRCLTTKGKCGKVKDTEIK